MQVVKPGARPVVTEPPLGLDVVVRWHRDWDAQALDILPLPRTRGVQSSLTPLMLQKACNC